MVIQSELNEVSKADLSKLQKLPITDPYKQKMTDKEEKHLREMCEYEFMNLEEPGLMQKFTYGNAKYKETFTLFHGQKYRLPRFVARHIDSRSTPMWTWQPDGTGRMQKMRVGEKSRFQMREVY